MPKNTLRAAAEGMPKISRRSVLSGLAAISAAATPGAALAAVEADIGARASSVAGPAAFHPDVEAAIAWLEYNIEKRHGGKWWVHRDPVNGMVAVSALTEDFRI